MATYFEPNQSINQTRSERSAQQSSANSLLWSRSENQYNAGTTKWQGLHTFVATDLICQGEIDGLVDLERSIEVDGAPLLADGIKTRPNIDVHVASGTLLQSPAWFAPLDQRKEIVDHEVTLDSPFEREVVMPEVELIEVVISVTSLGSQVTEGSGDQQRDYQVEGELTPYITVSGTTQEGSVNTPVEINTGVKTIRGRWQGGVHEFAFTYYRRPQDTGDKFIVKVWRTTHHSPTDEKYQDEFRVVRIIGHMPRVAVYPNIASVSLMTDSITQKQNPRRTYHIRGRKVLIPSHYDPELKLWASKDPRVQPINDLPVEMRSERYAWTDNTALVIRDILTSKDLQLDVKFSNLKLDEASFIAAAKRCDERVFGHPRSTCNILLNKPQKTFQFLNSILNEHGMNWSVRDGKLGLMFDSPKPPVAVFNNLNVLGGEFTYNGADATVQLKAFTVEFPDEELGYKSNQVRVEDSSIANTFAKEEKYKAVSITNRYEAERLARRKLINSKLETGIVTFQIPADGKQIELGDIIHIVDIPQKSAEKFSALMTDIVDFYPNEQDASGSLRFKLDKFPDWVLNSRNLYVSFQVLDRNTGRKFLFWGVPSLHGDLSALNPRLDLLSLSWHRSLQVEQGTSCSIYRSNSDNFKPMEYRVSGIRYDHKDRVINIEATMWAREKFAYIDNIPSDNSFQPWLKDDQETQDTIGGRDKLRLQNWTTHSSGSYWKVMVDNGEYGRVYAETDMPEIDPLDDFTMYATVSYRNSESQPWVEAKRINYSEFEQRDEQYEGIQIVVRNGMSMPISDPLYETEEYREGVHVAKKKLETKLRIVHNVKATFNNSTQIAPPFVRYEVHYERIKSGYGQLTHPVKSVVEFKRTDFLPHEMVLKQSSVNLRAPASRLDRGAVELDLTVGYSDRSISELQGKPALTLEGIQRLDVEAVSVRSVNGVTGDRRIWSQILNGGTPFLSRYSGGTLTVNNASSIPVNAEMSYLGIDGSPLLAYWENDSYYTQASMLVRIKPRYPDTWGTAYSPLAPDYAVNKTKITSPIPQTPLRFGSYWASDRYLNGYTRLESITSNGSEHGWLGYIYVSFEGDNTYSSPATHSPADIYPALNTSGQLLYVHTGEDYGEVGLPKYWEAPQPVDLVRFEDVINRQEWKRSAYDLIRYSSGETRPRGSATVFERSGDNWKVLAPPHKVKRVVVNHRHPLSHRWGSIVWNFPPMAEPTAVVSETVSTANNSLALRADFKDNEIGRSSGYIRTNTKDVRVSTPMVTRYALPYDDQYTTKLWKSTSGSSSGPYEFVQNLTVNSRTQAPVVVNDLANGMYYIRNDQPQSSNSKPRYIRKPAQVKYAELSKPLRETLDFSEYWNEPDARFEFAPSLGPYTIREGAGHHNTSVTRVPARAPLSTWLSSNGYSRYRTLSNRTRTVEEWRQSSQQRTAIYWSPSTNQVLIPSEFYEGQKFAPMLNGSSVSGNSWSGRLLPFPYYDGSSLGLFLDRSKSSRSLIDIPTVHYDGTLAASRYLGNRTKLDDRVFSLYITLTNDLNELRGLLRFSGFYVSQSVLSEMSGTKPSVNQGVMIKLHRGDRNLIQQIAVITTGVGSSKVAKTTPITDSYLENPTLKNQYDSEPNNDNYFMQARHFSFDRLPKGSYRFDLVIPPWVELVALEGMSLNKIVEMTTETTEMRMSYDSTARAFKFSTRYNNVEEVELVSWSHSDSAINNNKQSYTVTMQFGDEYIYAILYNHTTQTYSTSGTLTVTARVRAMKVA